MGRLLGQMDPNPCLADRRGGGSATGSEKKKKTSQAKTTFTTAFSLVTNLGIKNYHRKGEGSRGNKNVFLLFFTYVQVVHVQILKRVTVIIHCKCNKQVT